MAETIHIGRKISRIREIRGIKQDRKGFRGYKPGHQELFEDAIINYFHDQSSFNFQCTFNPLDKVMELYERLLQAEREKNELLKDSK